MIKDEIYAVLENIKNIRSVIVFIIREKNATNQSMHVGVGIILCA